MNKSPSPLPADRWLNSGYKVLGCLSRGSVAYVYDAWSEERECRCIAKVLHPDRVNDPKAQRALLREGLLLRELSHPHIVRLYEIRYDPNMEADKQDIFLTSLTVDKPGSRLLAEDEHGRRFALNMFSRQVTAL